MDAASIASRRLVRLPRALLRVVGDDRLVEQLRIGNDAAFEAIYERHHRGLLALCRHLLGSVAEAEDALQQTFAAAYRSLRDDARPVELRPWLYTVARNNCISELRRRSDRPQGPVEAGVSPGEEAEQRAEVRELLADLALVPEHQRSALVLSELGDLSHEEIATVVGCERSKVKSLVHQARQRLLDRRRARETPCEEVREQLASLRGGSLRRAWIQLHLHGCPGCRAHREDLRHQAVLLALTVPVPSAGLKQGVLAAAGGGGGGGLGGGGGALIGAGGTAGMAGAAGGGFSSLGSAAVAKAGIVLALAGGAVGGGVALERAERPEPAARHADADGSPDAHRMRDLGPSVSGREGGGERSSGSVPSAARSSTPALGHDTDGAEERGTVVADGSSTGSPGGGPPPWAHTRGGDGAQGPGRSAGSRDEARHARAESRHPRAERPPRSSWPSGRGGRQSQGGRRSAGGRTPTVLTVRRPPARDPVRRSLRAAPKPNGSVLRGEPARPGR